MIDARLALRVLLELSPYEASVAFQVAPLSATQQGLARHLGVTQGAVSKAVARLVAAGAVRSDRAHAPGLIRRVRVYSLTARGYDIVMRYRHRMVKSSLPHSRASPTTTNTSAR